MQKPTGHERASWAVYTQCFEYCAIHQIYSTDAKELHHHRPDKVNASGKYALLHMAMQNKFVQHIKNLKQMLANLADHLSGGGWGNLPKHRHLRYLKLSNVSTLLWQI